MHCRGGGGCWTHNAAGKRRNDGILVANASEDVQVLVEGIFGQGDPAVELVQGSFRSDSLVGKGGDPANCVLVV